MEDYVPYVGGALVEWLVFWTQGREVPGSNSASANVFFP